MGGSSIRPYPCHVKLRGLERMVSMADGASMKIVHSMVVTGDVDTLVKYLPEALTRTFNMHPRMRALQVKDDVFAAEIQAPFTIDIVESRNLLRLHLFTDSDSSEDSFENWQRYAEQECNVGFDRYSQFPFFLTVWINVKTKQARVMLFSDHYMSNGRSGMVVLNCILEQVALLSTQENNNDLKEHPLHISMYDMLLSKKFVSKALAKGVMKLFGVAIYRSEMKKFHPVLPARDDQHDFVTPPVENSTKGSFAQGDPNCMSKALVKCRSEDITVGGAVVVAILLAFYHAAKSQPDFNPKEPFKFMADIDYDMRQRVSNPTGKANVGAFICFCDLGWLANDGAEVETTRFWDLARRRSTEILSTRCCWLLSLSCWINMSMPR